MRNFNSMLRERMLSEVPAALVARTRRAPVELVEAAAAGLEPAGALEVGWGYAPGPVGFCSIGWCSRGICHLAFEGKQAGLPGSLQAAWPYVVLQRDDTAACRLAEIVFAGGRSAGKPLKVVVQGTPFQLDVWRSLLQIPRGHVATYGVVARAIGAPHAARAVGAACGANRVAYLIPCHRVVHANGSTRGYRWGAARKNALLEREFAD
jgi:AraC family transcriptional regulator of adaptative response/methylated-DNA-[protein]-cysteine methyltransferase